MKILIPNFGISNPFPVSKLKPQSSAALPAPPSPAFLTVPLSFPAQHQPPNIWVVVVGLGAQQSGEKRMFLCNFQAPQNRDPQRAPDKGRFLPPQHFEKLGEILAPLPSPALDKTETIRKEGEGGTETPANCWVLVGFFLVYFWCFFSFFFLLFLKIYGFVCFFLSFFQFKLEVWSPSSLLCAGGGWRITKIYQRPPLRRILLSPILKLLFCFLVKY